MKKTKETGIVLAIALGLSASASLLPEFGKLMKQDVGMPVEWDEKLFTERPKVWVPPEYATNGMKAVFYENVPFRGRETRVFAYVGIPKSVDGKPVPGMVLVHGGGGSAFYRWVKYWNDRGYAAISMDWNGCVSGNVKGFEQYPHETHRTAWGQTPEADFEMMTFSTFLARY